MHVLTRGESYESNGWNHSHDAFLSRLIEAPLVGGISIGLMILMTFSGVSIWTVVMSCQPGLATQ